MVEKTFPTWQNLLFPFIILGFLCIIFSFLFWDFEWITVRIWIFVSLIWGIFCEVDDYYKRRRNEKINSENKPKTQ